MHQTVLHIIQAIVFRKWFFLPTMVTGGFGELIGWTGRLWSSQNPNNFQAFVMQITTTIFACVRISPSPNLLGRSTDIFFRFV